MAISISGTTLTFNDNTTQTTAATGTVSSVATGNGLSGGTITTTGTLTVACPTAYSVGSYTIAKSYSVYPNYVNNNSNYSGGGGTNQMAQMLFFDSGGVTYLSDSGLSGTWKWMSRSNNNSSQGVIFGLVCRVS